MLLILAEVITVGSFGRRFRECRKMAGLKQVAAAKAIGVSQASISDYENDVIEPRASIVMRMAQVYGVTMDYLLGLVDERDAVWRP